jgi:hypothetical protein
MIVDSEKFLYLHENIKILVDSSDSRPPSFLLTRILSILQNPLQTNVERVFKLIYAKGKLVNSSLGSEQKFFFASCMLAFCLLLISFIHSFIVSRWMVSLSKGLLLSPSLSPPCSMEKR